MNKILTNVLFGSNSQFSMLFALAILIFVGLGCFGSSRSSGTVPAEYVGDWNGSDGSTLRVRSDASGDFIAGGTKVENGSVDVKNGKISVTFFGIGKTLKIDEAPTGNKMKLEGVEYTKSGATTLAETKSSDKKSDSTSDVGTTPPAERADARKGEMPSDEELQYMTKTTLLNFNEAIQKEDFADFHGTISKTWQKQTTPDTFNTAFKEFMEKGVDISEIRDLEANFTPQPSIDKSKPAKVLQVEGNYETSPTPTRFVLKYIPEGKEWKLFAIEVYTRSFS